MPPGALVRDRPMPIAPRRQARYRPGYGRPGRTRLRSSASGRIRGGARGCAFQREADPWRAPLNVTLAQLPLLSSWTRNAPSKFAKLAPSACSKAVAESSVILPSGRLPHRSTCSGKPRCARPSPAEARGRSSSGGPARDPWPPPGRTRLRGRRAPPKCRSMRLSRVIIYPPGESPFLLAFQLRRTFPTCLGKFLCYGSIMDESGARAALARLIEEQGADYSGLSRMLGRNPPTSSNISSAARRGVSRKRIAGCWRAISESARRSSARAPPRRVRRPRPGGAARNRASAGPGAARARSRRTGISPSIRPGCGGSRAIRTGCR